MYQLEKKLSFNYSDALCGHAEIGRQAWLRAKWEIPIESSSLSGRTNIRLYLLKNNKNLGLLYNEQMAYRV